jgi:hypothetical protein
VHTPDEEPVEGCQESIGTLDVGHVAAAGDHGERTFPEADDRLSRVGLREHPVACPPNDELGTSREGNLSTSISR